MATEIATTVDIAATADRVWEVLTDFPACPAWNPFITRITGAPTVGAKLHTFLKPPGGRGMAFKPTLLAADAPRELRWLGRLLVPGLFDGEHRFRIEEIGPGRVRLHQSESFRGVLVPLLLRFLEKGTRQGFEAMNAALKARAESPSA